MRNGRIILLNGTSSSGKSTLAAALRATLTEPFCYYASDQLADGGFRVIRQKARDARLSDERARFFDGFHRSIVCFAEAGNDIIVEMERRERERGDRMIGEALYHLKTHNYCRYDIEVDTTEPLDSLVSSIIKAWRARPSAAS